MGVGVAEADRWLDSDSAGLHDHASSCPRCELSRAPRLVRVSPPVADKTQPQPEAEPEPEVLDDDPRLEGLRRPASVCRAGLPLPPHPAAQRMRMWAVPAVRARARLAMRTPHPLGQARQLAVVRVTRSLPGAGGCAVDSRSAMVGTHWSLSWLWGA